MEDARTVRLLEHLAEEFINRLAERPGLYLLTKFHASDISDKTKQAHQGRVISFHTPFTFIKPRTLKESENE
jgi:hypothetical protein